jgi:uncharacterized protein HemX
MMRALVAMVALGFALLAGIGYLSRWSHQTPAEEAQAAAAERDEAAIEHHRREQEIADEQREHAEKQQRMREGYQRECEDKGLRFVGTLGDQVQCAP